MLSVHEDEAALAQPRAVHLHRIVQREIDFSLPARLRPDSGSSGRCLSGRVDDGRLRSGIFGSGCPCRGAPVVRRCRGLSRGAVFTFGGRLQRAFPGRLVRPGHAGFAAFGSLADRSGPVRRGSVVSRILRADDLPQGYAEHDRDHHKERDQSDVEADGLFPAPDRRPVLLGARHGTSCAVRGKSALRVRIAPVGRPAAVRVSRARIDSARVGCVRGAAVRVVPAVLSGALIDSPGGSPVPADSVRVRRCGLCRVRAVHLRSLHGGAAGGHDPALFLVAQRPLFDGMILIVLIHGSVLQSFLK